MSLGDAAMSVAGAKQGLKSAKGLTMGRYSHCQERRVYDWHSNQDSCFVEGTPLKTPEGSKPIEAFVMGDRILTRNEHDVNAPLTVGVVMQTFIRVSRIQSVLVEGRILETTPEHPFGVDGKGWIPSAELQEGDRLQTSLGYWLTCGGSVDSGKVLTVYNLEVAGDHTYFVGEQSWGFDVWVHNANGYIHQAVVNQKATVASGKNEGKIRAIDPETNKRQYYDQSKLDGDHILSKKQIADRVRDHEKATVTKLTPEQQKEVTKLQDSKQNLRPMDSSFNRSKQDKDATKWAEGDSDISKRVHPKYVTNTQAIQDSVKTQLDTLLNGFSS